MNTLSNTQNQIENLKHDATMLSRECMLARNLNNDKLVQKTRDNIRHQFCNIINKIIRFEETTNLPETETLKVLKRDLDKGHLNVSAIHEAINVFSEEITDIQDNINSSIQHSLRETGIDFGKAKVTKLEGNVVGQYNPGSESYKLDPDVLASNNLKHIIRHETAHGEKDKNAKVKGQNSALPEELEEAAAEKVAAISTGEKEIAYQEYLPHLAQTARAASQIEGKNVSTDNVLQLYKDGETDKLNQYHQASSSSNARTSVAANNS